MEWEEFNTQCCFVINGVTYSIPVSRLVIREVPRLDGGSPYFTDISGQRKPNYKNKQIYRDGELSWDELGKDWDDYVNLIRALFYHVGTNQIDFYKYYDGSTLQPANLIADVIPILNNNMMQELWDKRARMRPGSIQFVESNPQDVVAPT